MIKLIKADGTEIDLTNEVKMHFEPDTDWIKAKINVPRGYQEMVSVLDPSSNIEECKRAQLIVHEQGHQLGLSLNQKASRIYWRWAMEAQGADPSELTPIVGDVLLLTNRNQLT